MDIIRKLSLLKRACAVLGMEKYEEAIGRFIGNYDKSIKIMLVGEGKHGKSTLLNGLLGRKVASEGFAKKTANRNFYINSDKQEYVSMEGFESEKRDVINNEQDLQKYIKEFNKEKDSDMYWSLKLQWPQGDIVMVDTEGFNQANSHFEIENTNISYTQGMTVKYKDLFEEIYTEADIIIWCVKGVYCDSTVEKFKNKKAYNKPIFLVYTFADEDIDDETLGEIQTPEDLIDDMRMRLGEISEACVKDFAGFAGDYQRPERRCDFINSLRSEIDKYIDEFGEGLKDELGERLYKGIYNDIRDMLNKEIYSKGKIIDEYYFSYDELNKELDGIKTDYVKKIGRIIDELRDSISHEDFYQKAYENNGRNINKSFYYIEEFYNEIFDIADNLHEIIDTILPKKFEMLEQEYLLHKAYIKNCGMEEKDFSELWNIREIEFKKLHISARGIFRVWKSEEFVKYFNRLKEKWTEIINKKLLMFRTLYEQGFLNFLEENYGSSCYDIVCEILDKRYMLYQLDNMDMNKQVSYKEACIYGLKGLKRIVAVEMADEFSDKNNKGYKRYIREHKREFDAKRILFDFYIEKDFINYENEIKIKLADLYADNDEAVYEKIKNASIYDMHAIPTVFQELPSLIDENIDFASISNLNIEVIQAYYKGRVEILKTFWSEQRSLFLNSMQLKLRAMLKDWLFDNVINDYENAFSQWKKGLLYYCVYYAEEKKIGGAGYYTFKECLEREHNNLFPLYADCGKEEWDKIAYEVINLDDILDSEINRKLTLLELKNYISELYGRAQNEDKKSYRYICDINKQFGRDMLNTYLSKVKLISLRLSSSKLLSSDLYGRPYGIERKIKELKTELTLAEKNMLLNKYSQIERNLFGDFCDKKIYADIKEYLKEYYEEEMQKIILACVKK